jgi:hypothetical protein
MTLKVAFAGCRQSGVRDVRAEPALHAMAGAARRQHESGFSMTKSPAYRAGCSYPGKFLMIAKLSVAI